MSVKKPTILALCAHPDDAEIKCSGTLSLLAKKGWDIHIATASAGDCGSATQSPNEIGVIRRAEAIAAAKAIGATYHYLGGTDLHIYDDDFMRGAAVSLMREVDPDCVITHYPVDYMPDHTATSAIARTAIFCAPMPNFIYGQTATLAPTDRLVPLYYFSPLGGVDFFANIIEPQFYVDVTSVEECKVEMLACHVSQREWLRRQHGMDQYIEEMKEWDREAGKVVGVEYAEGLFMHKGHAYLQTPVIQEALAEFIHQP